MVCTAISLDVLHSMKTLSECSHELDQVDCQSDPSPWSTGRFPPLQKALHVALPVTGGIAELKSFPIVF